MAGAKLTRTSSRDPVGRLTRCTAVAIFQCEHGAVPDFEVRPARPQDAREMAELLAAVAEERDGIATEPPVDVDARTHEFAASAAGSLSPRPTARSSG